MSSRHVSLLTWCWLICLVVSNASDARAEFTSGSDGSDGALDCAWLAAHDPNDEYPDGFDCATCTSEPCSFLLNLDLAVDGHWRDTPGTGLGVYDADQWAVVYKFTTIDIPAGATVSFANHRSGAPVAWLAEGTVTIAGSVNLRGEDGFITSAWPAFSEPGPGGFPGGAPADRSALQSSLGFGPGSSPYTTANCPSAQYSGRRGNGDWYEHGGRVYGNPEVFPLIGGSGGGVYHTGNSSRSATTGGAGGGAILIATDGEMNLPEGSNIHAYGGRGRFESSQQAAGDGSGGAIRLVAGTSISGNPSLAWHGRYGLCGYQSGNGRLRIEAPTMDLPLTPDPVMGFTTSFIPGEVFPEADAPVLEVVSIAGVAAPSDPLAGPTTTEVEIDTDEASLVVIRAWNIPVGTEVTVRVVPVLGPEIIEESTTLELQPDGSLGATAQVLFHPGRSEIQLRANWDPGP